MIKNYKKWNLFEKKFFWINNIGIFVMMVGSFIVVMIPSLDNNLKAEIIGFLIMSYALFRTYIWNKLEKMEIEWKRITIDLTTKMDVGYQNNY